MIKKKFSYLVLVSSSCFFLFFLILSCFSHMQAMSGYDINEDEFTLIFSETETKPNALVSTGIANTLVGSYYLPQDLDCRNFETCTGSEHTYQYSVLCDPQLNNSMSRSIVENFPRLFNEYIYSLQDLSQHTVFQNSLTKTFGAILEASKRSTAISNFLGVFFETPHDTTRSSYLRFVHTGDSQFVLQSKGFTAEVSEPKSVTEDFYNYCLPETINYLTRFNENNEKIVTTKQHTAYMLRYNDQLIRTTTGISHLTLGKKFSCSHDIYEKIFDGTERFIILATYTFWKHVAPEAATQILEHEISKKLITELSPKKLARVLLTHYAELFENNTSKVKVTPSEVMIMVILFPTNLWNHRMQEFELQA